MARTPKRAPGSRPYVNYSKRQLMQAIQAITENKMSLNAASTTFKISKGTLSHAINKKHQKKPGRPCSLPEIFEHNLVNAIIKCSDWGFPLNRFDIRKIVQIYLNAQKIQHQTFKDNMPGKDWALAFMKRHSKELSERFANNIKRSRAAVGKEILLQYHERLSKSLEGLESKQIFNYDETNLADNPGRKKYLYRRGIKYPDKVTNYTKSCVTVMFAASADGTLLPPFVVYKNPPRGAGVLYTSWIKGGPKGKPCCNERCCKKGTMFDITNSGWFESTTFEKWFEYLFLPHAKNIAGKKAIIGDNLPSHFSLKVLQLCDENNITFICLPPNSTHLTQPLDVSFFRPLKLTWGNIIEDYKSEHPSSSSVDKSAFPQMLSTLLNTLQSEEGGNRIKQNIISGFKGTGICPLDVNALIKRLGTAADLDDYNNEEALNDSLTKVLQGKRFSKGSLPAPKRQKGGRLVNVSGFPVTTTSICEEGPADDPVPTNVPGDNITTIEYHHDIRNIKLDTFVIVDFHGKKRSMKYLAKVLNKDDEVNEVEVQCYKSVNESATVFAPLPERPTWIALDHVHCRELPTYKVNRQRLTVFDGIVPVPLKI